MARDNDIQIVAGLDIPKSKRSIDSDISILEKELQDDKSSRPKLIATLDINKSKKAIQANLDTLISKTDAPKIKVGIDVGGVNETRSITTGLQNVQNQVRQTTQSIRSFGENNNTVMQAFRQSLTNIGMNSAQIDTVANRINGLNVQIESLGQSMTMTTGRRGNKNVLSVNIAGIDELGQAVKLTQQYDVATGRLIKCIDAVSTATQKENSQLENLHAQQIKRQSDLRNQLNQIYNSAIDPNASRSIANPSHLSELENNYRIINDTIGSMGSTSKVVFAEQETEVMRLISELKNLVSTYKNAENVSTVLKPDKLTSAISKAESQFQSLNSDINNTNVTSEKLQQNIQVIKSILEKPSNGQIINKSEIEQVFTALSNARNELTALLKIETTNSSIERVKIQAQTLVNKLNVFAKNNSGFEKFSHSINGSVISVESLKTALSTVSSKSELNILKSQIDALKSAFNSSTTNVSQYGDEINRILKRLNTLNNNPTFRNNSANVDVQTQKQNIQNLITEYETLKIQLQGNMSFEGLQQLGDKLVVLKSQFDTVQAETDELKAKLNLSRDLNRMSKDIDILRNRIAIFRSENTKSEKTMGGTFNSLDTRLRDLKRLTDSGIFDKQAFANISRDFRNAEKEVKKFGLSGKTVFQTLGEQAKKFSSWMSLTYIIASLARSVRGAISELKEINTVLTEISKTSDRTTESLERLGQTSFDRASQYGRKASDYLTGVQEMSRAGFGEQESEDMAELSVLAQSAGDMTAELANQYLIATNAGYKLEGSAKRLNSVLDSQNYITNRNALNLSELAEATKIVSSQASQAGIGIDEMTAAVGTMIATTQQGGEVASRSFKGRRTICTIALYGCKSIAA